MNNITRYGIIGCGMMGQEHLRNIALLPGTQIAGIFDPDAEMARAAQALAPQAQLVDSVAALLALPDLDCIVIASPNFRHVEQLVALSTHRPPAQALPVLVEKPLFTDPAQLPALDAFIATYPAPIWVAMEYRYMPPVAALIDAAQDATGGVQMLSIREHRFPFLDKVGAWNRFNKYSGGTFVEKCCHFFDLMRLILRDDPVRVMASAGADANHQDERYDGDAPDILDNGYVIVDFAGGARAMLDLCMFAEGSQYQEEITITGPLGKAEALVPGPGRFWPADLGAPPVPALVLSPRAPKGPRRIDIPVDPTLLEAGDHNGSTFYQHQRFLTMVRSADRRADVDAADGRIAVLMGLAAQISAREHRVVHMDELG